jgi:glycosyltransferase involved in cell wall biosynthesis
MSGVSIIVPTYESWPQLQRTLVVIAHDARALGVRWEIILVDNESDPSLTAGARRVVGDGLRAHRRSGLGGLHFQPGAARNIGIEMAAYDYLIFLDSDCVPAAGLLLRYREGLEAHRDRVLLGHREFIDTKHVDPHEMAANRALLERMPRIASASNYGRTEDRRLPELRAIEDHARPYDCLYSCNFALHRACLGSLRFDPVYDGYWGYEDIDLGYRLHQAGRSFSYLPDAHVYHQEGGPLSALQRTMGRHRNFATLACKIPGFRRYRSRSSRPAALPNTIQQAA